MGGRSHAGFRPFPPPRTPPFVKCCYQFTNKIAKGGRRARTAKRVRNLSERVSPHPGTQAGRQAGRRAQGSALGGAAGARVSAPHSLFWGLGAGGPRAGHVDDQSSPHSTSIHPFRSGFGSKSPVFQRNAAKNFSSLAFIFHVTTSQNPPSPSLPLPHTPGEFTFLESPPEQHRCRRGCYWGARRAAGRGAVCADTHNHSFRFVCLMVTRHKRDLQKQGALVNVQNPDFCVLTQKGATLLFGPVSGHLVI